MNEEAKGFEISLKKWNSLSKEDQATLRKLGVKPRTVKAKTPKEPKVNPFHLEEYNLGVRQVCSLCGAQTVSIFHMDEKDGCLVKGAELPPGTPHSREIKIEVKHCEECFDRLQLWTKEELVERLIEEMKGGTNG